MAFGGPQDCFPSVFGFLATAKQIVADLESGEVLHLIMDIALHFISSRFPCCRQEEISGEFLRSYELNLLRIKPGRNEKRAEILLHYLVMFYYPIKISFIIIEINQVYLIILDNIYRLKLISSFIDIFCQYQFTTKKPPCRFLSLDHFGFQIDRYLSYAIFVIFLFISKQ